MEARKSLDFQYPFPTLKQRAIVTVCRHWIDNKLVQQLCDGSSEFSCQECKKNVYKLTSNVANFVDNLAVPNPVKVDIYHVLDGLCNQLSVALRGFFCCLKNKIGVHIDDSGRFDYLGFLRCCFKKNLDKDLQILYALFSIACRACLLPEIDLVLKKIVATVDGEERDSEMLLEQPTHQSINNKHVLTYGFLHEADAGMVDRLNAMSNYMNSSSSHANQERITITLDPFNFNIDALKEHINLLEPRSRNRFVGSAICGIGPWGFGTAYELEVVKYLDQESNRGWADVGDVLASFSSHCFQLPNKLLYWPFTQFFTPTLNLLSPHVRDVDYCELFASIVSRIPQRKDPEYATLHRGLLHSLWSAMPLRLKQDCANWHHAKVDEMEQLLHGMKKHCSNKRHFLDAMRKLKITAPPLFNELVTEMQAMCEER